MPEEWLGVKGAAEYLGISERAIYKLMKDGKLAAYKQTLRRRTLFRRADLEALQEVKPYKNVPPAGQ